MAAGLDQSNNELADRTAALLEEVGERPRAEEVLRLLNKELERRVQERTAELGQTNDELRAEIARRQQATEALRASEERYRTVVEDMPALVCRFLPNGVLTFVNQPYCAYFGRPREELIGQDFFRFIPEEDRPGVLAHYSRLTPANPAQSYEHRVLAPGGAVRWQQWTGRALFDGDGCPVEYQSVGQDITERRQAEQHLRASLREKEALLKEIHHRVKNNLQIISSLLALQASHIDDRRAREMFQDSQNRIRSIALIHERLYQTPDLAHVDFARYVDGLVVELFRSYGTRAAGLSYQVQVESVHLALDTAIPCSLIINELVSNALKHAFPNGRAGHVSVSLCRADGFFRLSVEDNGIGLPPGLDLAQASSLGLQLVATLAEQLRGSVEHRSTPGGGTQFCIVFPAVRQARG